MARYASLDRINDMRTKEAMGTRTEHITRANYRDFCTESELTKDEQQQWHVMARAIREQIHGKPLDDSPLFCHIQGETEAEHAAYRAAELCCTRDWSDVAAFADACRRLKRAEVAAWLRWQDWQH